MSSAPEIRFIWPEKNIDITDQFYQFRSQFRNDPNATFICAKLEPALMSSENVLVEYINFSDFKFNETLLTFDFDTPKVIAFDVSSLKLITITIVNPSIYTLAYFVISNSISL